jgi:hypothetical protein
MADRVYLMRVRVAEELQELAAAADVQPPLEVPSARVRAFIGVDTELPEAGLRTRAWRGGVAAVAKLGFVAYAAPGTWDSQHGLASQCA